jgi:hypothetical protein
MIACEADVKYRNYSGIFFKKIHLPTINFL